MNPVRISCEGVAIGSISIPPLQLRAGEVVCLHMPGPVWSEAQQQQVVQVLTGQCPVPGVHLFGQVAWARPACNLGSGLMRLFRPTSVLDWLCRSAGVSRAEAAATAARLGLRTDERVCQLGANPRTLLGLEAAWARGAEVIVFSTVGCDPLGTQAVYEEVLSRLDRRAAVHLSYPFTQNGKIGGACFPRGLCIELTRQPGLAVSLTPAQEQG